MFATQFVVYGSPGLVKLEIFDMEPELLPDGKATIQKGPSRRFVMTEQSARNLMETLRTHLENNNRAAAATQQSASPLSVYADTARIHTQFRKGVEKDNLLTIAGMLDNLAKAPAGNIRKAAGNILDRMNGKEKSLDMILNDESLFDLLRVRLLPFTSDQLEEDLLIALAGYVVCCESGENKSMRHISQLIGEI